MKIDKVDVINAGHEGAWKYFVSAYNAYEAMRAYRHLIKECLDRKKHNFESIIKGEKEITENERFSFPPGDFVCVDGLNMSLQFLVSIYTQSFFQCGRNCFDYIAQIIAEFFGSGVAFHNIDFNEMSKKKKCLSIEEVEKYIDDIVLSNEYKYLCDYNNLIKHNYDLGVSITVNTDSLDMIGKIPAFEKNTRMYNVEDMEEKMKKIHKLAVDAYGDLLKLIWPEKSY